MKPPTHLKANLARMFHWWPFTDILFSSNMTAIAGHSFKHQTIWEDENFKF